jgi:hypothetical protein
MSNTNTKAPSNLAVSIKSLVSEWDDFMSLGSTTENPQEIKSEQDLLAMTCSLLRTGFESYEVVSYLKDPELYKDRIEPTITSNDVQLANKIRKYFSKKHMLRRIKGDYVSPWMNKVDELCETPQMARTDNIPVLVTLPRYYDDNIFIEGLMKDSVSAPSDKNVRAFEDTVEFVTKRYRTTRHYTAFDYYWKTSKNELVIARIPTNDLTYKAWDFVAKQSRVKMEFKHPYVSKIKGYDFLAHYINTETEITSL